METAVTIFLAVIFMVLLVIVALALSPKTSGKGVNIKLDERAALKINQSGDGVQIELKYNDWQDRPSDAELFPDIVNNDPPPQGSLDRSFWQMYANFDSLTAQERESILMRLVEHGLLRPEEVEKFHLEGEEQVDLETGEPAGEPGEPEEPDLNPGRALEEEFAHGDDFENREFSS